MAFKNKLCKECGVEFTPRNGSQVYCSGPHYTVCEFCGKSFSYTCSPKEKPRYCSQSCINEGKKLTVQTRYGVSNVSELSWVQDKISERNSSEEVAARRRATCMERYGVDNVSKSPRVIDKLKQFSNSEEYRKKAIETSVKHYGVPYPMQSPQVIEARNKTCLERYGTLRPPMSVSQIRNTITDGSKAEEFLAFKTDPISYINTHFNDKPTINELRKCLGVTDTPIYDILVANNCSDLIFHKKSTMEHEIIKYITSVAPDTRVVHNDRTIIKPLEIDIYLPELDIGIECNPTSTHNSSINDPWGQPPKHYRYHQLKSERANSCGIFLFHIFGYEWENKRNIIESMLSNLLGCNSFKMGARSTVVCEVPVQEAKAFLNANHRQGYAVSSIFLGLRNVDDNALVSVMAFSKPRSTLGKRDSTEECWELTRYCSKLGYSVQGGASKLLKAFRTSHTGKIFSFSDISHTRGTVYSKLGFTKVGSTPPSYVWVSIDDKIVLSRVACQKQKLSKLFNEEIDLSKTEKQIMEEHGFVRIYDCGVCKWELS